MPAQKTSSEILFDRIFDNRLTREQAAFIAETVTFVLDNRTLVPKLREKIGTFGIDTLRTVMLPAEDE